MEKSQKDYDLIFPESPIKKKLNYIFNVISMLKHEAKSDDSYRAIENADYLLTVKYLNKVKYNGDVTQYIAALMASLKGAKYEFSEVCFDNDDVDVLFALVQQCLLELIADNHSVTASTTDKSLKGLAREESYDDSLPEPKFIDDSEYKELSFFERWYTRICTWKPFCSFEVIGNALLESAGFDFVVGWSKKDVYIMAQQYNKDTLVGYDAGQSDEGKWWETGYSITDLDFRHIQCANLWCLKSPEKPILMLYFRNNELYKVSKVEKK